MKAWCLFEQSGTFKKEFIKLGVNAVDIDIRDDFAQTDYKSEILWKSDYAKGENRQTLRSLISQTYANRFIREYIL